MISLPIGRHKIVVSLSLHNITFDSSKMVPLNDNNPTEKTPYVTYVLIITNVLVFFHEMSLSSEELAQFFQ